MNISQKKQYNIKYVIKYSFNKLKSNLNILKIVWKTFINPTVHYLSISQKWQFTQFSWHFNITIYEKQLWSKVLL